MKVSSVSMVENYSLRVQKNKKLDRKVDTPVETSRTQEPSFKGLLRILGGIVMAPISLPLVLVDTAINLATDEPEPFKKSAKFAKSLITGDDDLYKDNDWRGSHDDNPDMGPYN